MDCKELNLKFQKGGTSVATLNVFGGVPLSQKYNLKIKYNIQFRIAFNGIKTTTQKHDELATKKVTR